MVRSAAPGADEFVPASHNLAELSGAVQSCKGCDLYLDATQAVFGAGSRDAGLMLIGEQPGDQEDKAGSPFVGPAGKLLDRALLAAGIDRNAVYVTNAVKHFKFTLPERGKRRIHKTPSRTEVVACRPWLLAELDAVRPDVIVLLGATAAKALMGSDFRLTQHRGEELQLPALDAAPDLGRTASVVATVHPSSVLRGPPDDRERAFEGLTDDLRVAARLLPGQ